MGLGALPDYMQGMMSPEEFLRANREQGMSDFNINNPAPPGTLGTLSSRSLFGGNTGQNGPLVSAVNKYNYAQRDAYQRAMLTGTQQAHAMNLQNTQQAQQMLNDNRNFGLNRQNMLGNQYLRAQEIQNQARNDEARVGLDTRVHSEMMPLRQQQTNTDTARQQAEERLGNRRLGVDEGRLAFDTRAHSDLLPIRQQEANTTAARQVSDDRLGTGRLALDETTQQDRTGLERGRLDLDTVAAMRRAKTDELNQQAAAGVSYMNARTTANQANTDATRVTNEGRIGEGQLGVNRQQANTQQAEAQARAYNEDQRNVASFADIATRRGLGEADISERSRQRQTEYFLGLQQALNNQQDILNRNQQEANRLALDRQHYTLSEKVAHLTAASNDRRLTSDEYKTLLDYTTKLKQLENQKAQINNEGTIGAGQLTLGTTKAEHEARLGAAQLAAKTSEIAVARERNAADAVIAARRVANEASRNTHDFTLGTKLADLREREGNLGYKEELGRQLTRLKEIEAQDRATQSNAAQNAERVAQARHETFARQATAHDQNEIEIKKAMMRQKIEQNTLDYKKAFDKEHLGIMRDKLGIEEDNLRALQQDIANKNYNGMRNFQLKVSSSHFNQAERTVDILLKRAGQMFAAAAHEKDAALAMEKHKLAESMAREAYDLGMRNLQEIGAGRQSRERIASWELDQADKAEQNRAAEADRNYDLGVGRHNLEQEIGRANINLQGRKLNISEEGIASAERIANARIRLSKRLQKQAHRHEESMQEKEAKADAKAAKKARRYASRENEAARESNIQVQREILERQAEIEKERALTEAERMDARARRSTQQAQVGYVVDGVLHALDAWVK